MFIESKEKYVPELSELWKTVFDDEDGYIALFFGSAYKSCKCFAHFENSKIVSALYLLDCSISLNQKLYEGCYLYAAATYAEHRGRGLMKKLIEEAKEYMKSRNKAFIALVPATASLYDYYSKFGFQTAMEKYSGKAHPTKITVLKRTTSSSAFARKQKASFDRFIWTQENHRYAADCAAYYESELFESDNGIILTDKDSVKEAFAQTPEECELLLDGCAGVVEKGATVDCPFELSGFEKKAFGMIYSEDEFIKERIKNKKIYMNLALD